MLLAVAQEAGGGVVESVWRGPASRPDLAALGGTLVEVFCDCESAVARERYRQRASTRSPGHFDTMRLASDDLWTGESAEPIAGPWPVVHVHTDRPVALADVAVQVRHSAVRGLQTRRDR